MTIDASPNVYPLFNSETRANPQAMYEQMRQHDPVYCHISQLGNPVWILTRYEDVLAVLKDQRFIKDGRKHLPKKIANRYYTETAEPTFEAINRHMLNLDPPDHTRLRSLVHKAFTPKRVRDLEPRIQQIAKELLDAMQRKSEGDLLDDFAFPLPITVIAEMLGVEAEKRAQFREWSQIILFSTDYQANIASIMAFVHYINELIDVRRGEDQGDILSALVRVEEEGDTLDHMELLSMVFLLLVAGHETTVNLIGNGTLALLQHPDQFEKLKAHPELMRTAVEEMLRYNGPVETPTTRFAIEDVDWQGYQIKQGDVILPSLLAANRDPDVFDKPNTFDITRDPNPHVAFGHGIHYCLGAPLARLEGIIAIRALIERLPDLQLNTAAGELEWNSSILIHGMKALPVRY